jgi:hypothetical protein
LPGHRVFLEIVADRDSTRVRQCEERRLGDVEVDHVASNAHERSANARHILLWVSAVRQKRREPARAFRHASLDLGDILVDQVRQRGGILSCLCGAQFRLVFATNQGAEGAEGETCETGRC